jgi:hypothetical protein
VALYWRVVRSHERTLVSRPPTCDSISPQVVQTQPSKNLTLGDRAFGAHNGRSIK